MTHAPYRLRNATRRPIEIHRGAAVTMLAPGDMLDVDVADAELDPLERSGALTRHAAPERAPPAPDPAPIDEGNAAPPGPAGARKLRTKTRPSPKRPSADASGELP